VLRATLRFAACAVFTACLAFSSERCHANKEAAVNLSARTRVETSEGSGRYHAIEKKLDWKPSETAVVVCDMWDDHWCRGASSRVAEMAPRMNEFLKAARSKGIFIIHCPSECMDFYKDTPQRKRAMDAPAVKTERPIERWCALDKAREGGLPIDDSDGGCDCEPRCKNYKAWKRQIATLEIADEDAITDSAEAYYLMRERGIKNVIVLGVHTNMCVLGRPFSIRQMVYQGQNVVLVRDLTDTMYNPRAKPFVSHFSGTDLIVEHIERHWCPTILSGELLGGDHTTETLPKEFRFASDKRPTVAVLMAEDEYVTERTLPEFTRERLAKDMRISLIYGSETERNDVPGIDAIRDADILLISVRRRTLKKEQLAVIRDHVAAGKGVVGIRTASHAFAPLGNAKVEEGDDAWPEFDRNVLGGNYTGHYGTTKDAKDRTRIEVIAAAADHLILRNVDANEFESASWLYKVSPLAKSATPLLLGHAPGDHPAEPVAWANQSGKSRVFYTSLGHKGDFESPAFKQLLENGIRWAGVEETAAKE
jgi:type 1 glutamine amidotransferase/nicotinamidase-related amidase